jgi:hypothetical protein
MTTPTLTSFNGLSSTSMTTPTPTSFNDQHNWGGQTYQQESAEMARRNAQSPTAVTVPSQVGIHASNSDDLFFPLNNVVSSYPYTLQEVPSNTAYSCSFSHHLSNAYIPVNRAHLSQPLFPPMPQHNVSSSYNNPNFIPPSPVLHSPHTPNANVSPHPMHHQPFHSSYQQHQDHFQCQQFSNNNVHSFIPPQYVYYIPTPSPQSPTTKTLPSVSHIPIPTSKVDFFAWDEAVTLLLHADGIIGHILDPLDPVDPSRPDRVPILMPVFLPLPTPTDLADLSCWWDTDNTAQHVLTSQIGSIPCGLLPSPSLVTRTALSIYQTLTQYYGNSSFADCADLLNSLHQMSCQPGCVQEYMLKWQTGIS